MKKSIKYLSLFLAASLAVTACKKSFLDVRPKGTDLESNYYRNQTEAFNGLNSCLRCCWMAGRWVCNQRERNGCRF
jgi:ABC-type oligopeptide transport system substrate-binding subunit